MVLADVSSETVPCGGDIHKLHNDFDFQLEPEWRADDAKIRSLPTWSSKIPDPAATQVRFKYRANGHYLSFLSLFLTEVRQVDIGFPRRHALILFLLHGLEKSHAKYARRKIPEELEYLQMMWGDEMELQVWQAFIRAPCLKLGVLDYTTDEDGRQCSFVSAVNRIRQLAVHRSSTYRWNFDTSVIKGAAACARSLGDDALVENIELVVKVLYAVTGGDPEYAVTEDQRKRANNLLWPSNRQPGSTYQLLDQIQNVAEKSSYSFCQRSLPQELLWFQCTTAEHFELSQWRKIIMRRWSRVDSEDSDYFLALSKELEKADITKLRNAVAHRHQYTLDPSDEFYDQSLYFKGHISDAKEYVRALGDENAALEIERLEHEVLPLLNEKYGESLNPQWCENRDLDALYQVLSRKQDYWEYQHKYFWEKYAVNVAPIRQLYGSAMWRLSNLEKRLRMNGASPESLETNTEQAPCEPTVEPQTDLRPWPTAFDPPDPPSYEEDSSPSINHNDHDRGESPSRIANSPEQEQEDGDTTSESDCGGIEEGENDNWSWNGPEDGVDSAPNSPADQGMAAGDWLPEEAGNSDDGDDTSANWDEAENRTHQLTKVWPLVTGYRRRQGIPTMEMIPARTGTKQKTKSTPVGDWNDPPNTSTSPETHYYYW
ncbi:MAG: hypothetical protein Q9171_006438 [Xanthocarpia ochracea]